MAADRNRITNRKLETLIYAGLWLIAIILFLLDIMRARTYTDLPLLDFGALGHLLLNLLPFLILFAINNYLLIPKFLKKGHYAGYFMWVLTLIVAIWLWQQFQFFNVQGFGVRPLVDRPPHPGPHPIIPLPLFLDVIYDILIVGVNLAISLLFQQFADRLKQESQMKENAEIQLTYLKAQINPHFYMNMLNNIHGMIEIDAEKAQDMVIEMSRLMRYMLYDSSRPEIELSAEIKFINDYLDMMRVRYPGDIVKITASLPKPGDVAGIKVPPLLFLVFLENSFKHGITYSTQSFVAVSLSCTNGHIVFCCRNSIHKKNEFENHQGIGLKNVRRRLEIIYDKRYNLEIVRNDSEYNVTLKLPVYETKDSGHRR